MYIYIHMLYQPISTLRFLSTSFPFHFVFFTLRFVLGSKFYWRMRVNVDLHFFFHTKYDTLEVIPFNVERQEEMDRLYINYTSLSKKIDLAYKEKYEKTKQDIAKDRFKKMPPETELHEKNHQ